MPKKPTYKDLEQKVKALEKELGALKRVSKKLQKSESRLKEAEHIAGLGHWELDISANKLYWSDEIYRIFDLEPQEFKATYEAFLGTVHPDDRKRVDKAYTDSLKQKTDYDIVHRLLLKDGTIKYVNEKCHTVYDDNGTPLRSIGTVQDITKQKKEAYTFSGIIGRNIQMTELFDTIKEVADVKIPVLIQGESGTGKELVAKAIHNEGVRAGKPFVAVNCGALPDGLLESELFGHVKGAFTGAIKDRKGRFELAAGGTLFLDEVGDLPKPLQVKLLRVLQEGTFEPVGSEKTVSADVRIISASNRDLKQAVKRENFRDDLYYRLGVIPIQLPPLRERKDDIPILTDYFLERAVHEGLYPKGISKDALADMIDYEWPGNVRELQSAVWFALIKAKGKAIQPVHLPMELRREQRVTVSGKKKKESSRGRSMKLEPAAVKDALKKSGGNKAKASRLLSVGRATLYRYLETYPDIEQKI